MSRRGVAGMAVLVGLASLGGWQVWRAERNLDDSLHTRLAAMTVAHGSARSTCGEASQPPLRLLILGQSNAGNHGAETEVPARADNAQTVDVFTPQGCWRGPAPLPGGTGTHQSIWTRLGPHLATQGLDRPIQVALMAVDATTIADWTRAGSPLRVQFDGWLQDLQRAGFRADVILWQQGESDARLGTTAQRYVEGMEQLRAHLTQRGASAPLVMARSTRCRSSGGQAIRSAQDTLVARHADMRIGPDTDVLDGDHRVNDCHFTRQGLDAAAQAWARGLAPLLRGAGAPIAP